MTINHSQGQSVARVAIDLCTPVFAHGQLYVAFSRVTALDSIKVRLPSESPSQTTNMVYPEILLNWWYFPLHILHPYHILSYFFDCTHIQIHVPFHVHQPSCNIYMHAHSNYTCSLCISDSASQSNLNSQDPIFNSYLLSVVHVSPFQFCDVAHFVCNSIHATGFMSANSKYTAKHFCFLILLQYHSIEAYSLWLLKW